MNDASVNRGRQKKELLRLHSLHRFHMTSMPTEGGRQGQLTLTNDLVPLQHVPDLLPRRLHVVILILLNHACSESSRDTETWIQVQFVNPILPV